MIISLLKITLSTVPKQVYKTSDCYFAENALKWVICGFKSQRKEIEKKYTTYLFHRLPQSTLRGSGK